MNYEFPADFPARIEDTRVIINEEIKVVQIVPISSTLTTFEKMWSRLKKAFDDNSLEKVCLSGNYSVLWVMNSDTNKEAGKPSKLEEAYWSEYSDKKNLIYTIFNQLDKENRIRYYIRKPIWWEDPLDCKLCYPPNVLDEVPLVETDQTSTVPTQQIRKKRKIKTIDNTINNDRLLKLDGSVAYGHIYRDRNHFQYYIDTQYFFYQVKDEVRGWLENCRDNRPESENDFPKIHIIFSPEHNTNVGFAQFVNVYYFGGTAEIVSVNEDKEYKSNFECEHTALIQTIENLFRNIEVCSMEDLPVKFYYVDDTIISGETFQKANGFLKKLLPNQYRTYYATNVISKCFLLVERLSWDTKKNYVTDVEQDFCSFLHIDISNMRTQGDSCVGCKLEKDSVRLFKRSATNNQANYWLHKIGDFRPIAYNDRNEMGKRQSRRAYLRLLMSHITQNVIFNDNSPFEYGNVYDAILAIAFKLIGGKGKEERALFNRVNFQFDSLIIQFECVTGLEILLKVVSRPFFSYDFKVKSQVLTMLIMMTEVFLGNETMIKAYCKKMDSLAKNKRYLAENDRCSLTIKIAKKIIENTDYVGRVAFLQNCLMKCLADMRSTYLLRRNTIANFYQYIDKNKLFVSVPCQREKNCKKLFKNEMCNCNIEACFWRDYAHYVHYIVDGSSDEMRSLGLEYMLITGKEHRLFEEQRNVQEENFKPEFLYKCITGIDQPQRRDLFYIFCHELFFQNTRIHFDGMEKVWDRGDPSDSYYMDHWKEIQSLNRFKSFSQVRKKGEMNQIQPSREEKDLFEYIERNCENKTDSLVEVTSRYKTLFCHLVNMMKIKYDMPSNQLHIALLTLSHGDEVVVEIKNLDILADINVIDARERYYIKERVEDALKQTGKEAVFSLEEDGYFISDDESIPYVILYFKNQFNDITTQIRRTTQTIAKVFLYISIRSQENVNTYFCLRFILRNIMTYKNRIMRMFENDFAGDMFTKYAHTMGEKNIFAHEKAVNHNTLFDNDELLTFLEHHTESGKYNMLDTNQSIKWLTLKSYVNEQIARIFNRCFRKMSREELLENAKRKDIEMPGLYIKPDSNQYLKDNPFCQRFEQFIDLNFLSDDRFALLNSVIDFEFHGLKAAKIILGPERESYNLEYVKCLFFDILFSAMKHESDWSGFLERINGFLENKKKMANKDLLDKEYVKLLENDRCRMKIYREISAGDGFDYLIFQNPVTSIILNYTEKNDDIRRRIKDPLDYQDGHISLLTIKQYIEGLRTDLLDKTVFEYVKTETGELVFHTKLPILVKES